MARRRRIIADGLGSHKTSSLVCSDCNRSDAAIVLATRAVFTALAGGKTLAPQPALFPHNLPTRHFRCGAEIPARPEVLLRSAGVGDAALRNTSGHACAVPITTGGGNALSEPAALSDSGRVCGASVSPLASAATRPASPEAGTKTAGWEQANRYASSLARSASISRSATTSMDGRLSPRSCCMDVTSSPAYPQGFTREKGSRSMSTFRDSP